MPLGCWMSVTMHVLAALLWLGGMFFLGVVGAPVLRAVEPVELGHALAVKLVAVAMMVIISATHDFALGPAAGRVSPGSPSALRLRRRAAMLARLNALIGIALVVAAVRLARGG